MSIWDLNESAVAKKVLDDRKDTDIGTVTRVVEHTTDEDASNFEVFVSIEGGNRIERFAAVSSSKRDSIEVPSVGDTVLVEYLGDQSRKPVIVAILSTSLRRALLGKAGMNKSRVRSSNSAAGGGDLYVTTFTGYDREDSGPELNDPLSLAPEAAYVQVSKKEEDSSDPRDEESLPFKVEVYDGPKDDEAHISVEINKVAGGDSDTTWGMKFDIKTGEIKIVDPEGYGITSDGFGNFEWEYKTIEFIESESQGSKSI